MLWMPVSSVEAFSASSLVIAIFWWVWHLPLFSWASYGSVHYQWGWFTPEFWGFMSTVIALGLLLTWAALLNRGSILAAILLHFFFNLTFGLTSALSGRLMLISAILLWLTLALLVWLGPAKGILQRRVSNWTNSAEKERISKKREIMNIVSCLTYVDNQCNLTLSAMSEELAVHSSNSADG